MFYQIPPVGNSISLGHYDESLGSSLFPSYQTQYYASGTAALAASIIAAINIRGKQKNTVEAANCDQLEVILPAYGCPDLISAIVHAGAKPVLVDIEADRPWLCLSELSSAITPNTVAIIAVNLFGIAERWEQLREVIGEKNIVLIEDSAQGFPVDDAESNWQGDMVVLSFGRGKPVSLLGGGAVLVKDSLLEVQLPKPKQKDLGFIQRLLFGLKARLYNVMISPYVYWILVALPFLHLGETRYHPLAAIEAMDQVRLALLKGNISNYQNDIDSMKRGKKISSMLDGKVEIDDLPQLCGAQDRQRFLRYPLLLSAECRDDVYEKLKRAGLGVSILYPASLPEISGLNKILDEATSDKHGVVESEKQHFPNAANFASRLLTLPTHAQVSEKDLEKISALLKQ